MEEYFTPLFEARSVEKIKKVDTKTKPLVHKKDSYLAGAEMTLKNEGRFMSLKEDVEKIPHIGYGFNLTQEHVIKLISEDVLLEKRELTKDEGRDIFFKLYNVAESDAKKFIGEEWDKLPDDAKKTIANMSYRTGLPKLSKFTEFKKALLALDYKKAAEEIRTSKSYKNEKGTIIASMEEHAKRIENISKETKEETIKEIIPEEKHPSYFTPLGESISIKKDDNSFTKMTKFQKVLDIIGRPGYAIKSIMIESAKKTEAQRQWEDMPYSEFKKLSKKEQKKLRAEVFDVKRDLKLALKAAWKGFSGQERIRFRDIMEEAGLKRTGKAITDIPLAVFDFIGEIQTDPLMWFGGAGYKAITKSVMKIGKVGIKAVTKVPGVTKGVTKVVAKAEPVISGFKKAFIDKTKLPKLAETIEKHLLKREYLKTKELQYGVKVRNVIQNISKKTGKSIDNIEKTIVSAIEQPHLMPKGISTGEKVLANTLKSHFSNILTKEMKAGVPITHLAKSVKNIEYFPRITTKEAVQYLKQARIGNNKIWNTKLANALRRKTGEFTLEEFNSFVAEHGLKILGGRSVEQFFMKSPAYAVTMRGVRSAKAVTSAQFLDDVGRIFGTKADKAPLFYKELPETVTKLNSKLKGLKFDPEIVDEVSRVTVSYFNKKEIGGALKVFDTVQNYWKKWTLAPFPKYHLRNMIGNMWNNYLAGVNPKNYPKAQAIQMYRKYKSTTGKMNEMALKNLKVMKITPQQANKIIMEAEKTGVVGHGWYGADIESTIEKLAKGKKGFIGLPLKEKIKKTVTGEIVIEKGMAFGSTVENNARLAHFIDRVGKGDDYLTAAKSVKKFLFDYGDLTAFEKQVMKRVFPFYTWTRKNIPLQFEQLIKQPEKQAKLLSLLRNRDAKDLLRLKYTRPDLYERLPVELSRDINTVTYVPLEGLIPAGDLVKFGESLKNIKDLEMPDFLVELLSPYLRAPIELKMDKSFYFESEIQRYDKETQELLRLDIPVKLKYLITTIAPQARLVNELNKLIKKQIRKEKLTAGEQAFHQTLSSVYKINLKDLRMRALQALNRKANELKTGMFWAKRNKREKEYERIKETWEELKKQIKEVR